MLALLAVFVVVAEFASSSFAAAVDSAGFVRPDSVFAVEPPSAGPAVAQRPLQFEGNAKKFNVIRLRYGVGPLPPRRTRTSSTTHAQASPTSCSGTPRQGKVAVYHASNNTFLGFIPSSYSTLNAYYFSASDDALAVRLPESAFTRNAPFEMAILNGRTPAFTALGAAGDFDGYNFETGQLNYAYITGTEHITSTGPSFDSSHAMKSTDWSGPAESSIWRIDCATLAITAHWTNEDDTQVTTSLVAGNSYLAVVGNYDAYASTHSHEEIFRVTLKYVPDV